MILRRVPISMLVALGLLPVDACKCPLGPCLKPAVDEPDVGPCLSEPARDTDVDEPPANACLAPVAPDTDPPPPPPDPRLEPCLSVPSSPPAPDGKGGGKGAPPSSEPFARAGVVQRVLERSDLPADVIARLRGRA